MKRKELTMKENKFYETIKLLSNKKISFKRAVILLNYSKKQVRRLLNRYQKYGKKYFIHKNSNKTSHNKINQFKKDKIINLYIDYD